VVKNSVSVDRARPNAAVVPACRSLAGLPSSLGATFATMHVRNLGWTGDTRSCDRQGGMGRGGEGACQVLARGVTLRLHSDELVRTESQRNTYAMASACGVWCRAWLGAAVWPWRCGLRCNETITAEPFIIRSESTLYAWRPGLGVFPRRPSRSRHSVWLVRTDGNGTYYPTTLCSLLSTTRYRPARYRPRMFFNGTMGLLAYVGLARGLMRDSRILWRRRLFWPSPA